MQTNMDESKVQGKIVWKVIYILVEIRFAEMPSYTHQSVLYAWITMQAKTKNVT